jgi:hypothetical protein
VKRKLELEVKTVDTILEILSGLLHAGIEMEKFLENEGQPVPKKLRKQNAKTLVAHMQLGMALRSVEIAELEEVFALEQK